jgi:c-di-GMP-binding flagellar brake protein YcgR
LFWRKKKADEFEIELDEPPREASERRESFRIGSDPSNPVLVTVDGVDYTAANLSAGGLAIRAPGLQAGQRYSIRLQLPDGIPVILTEVDVINATPQGLCRCKFLQLSAVSRNALHRYILDREKQRIRKTRTGHAVADDGE